MQFHKRINKLIDQGFRIIGLEDDSIVLHREDKNKK